MAKEYSHGGHNIILVEMQSFNLKHILRATPQEKATEYTSGKAKDYNGGHTAIQRQSNGTVIKFIKLRFPKPIDA